MNLNKGCIEIDDTTANNSENVKMNLNKGCIEIDVNIYAQEFRISDEP